MKKFLKIIGVLLVCLLLIVGALELLLYAQKPAPKKTKSLHSIEVQVAKDAEAEYYIVKRNGSDLDSYVHAGFVAAAYLQANDEANYKKWKKIEKEAGKKAGL